MLTVIAILLFAGTIAFDFLPKVKKQAKKDSIIYCAFILISFGILLLFSLNIKIPGPSGAMKNFVETVFMTK